MEGEGCMICLSHIALDTSVDSEEEDNRSLPVLKECCSHRHLIAVGDLVGRALVVSDSLKG